MDLQSWILATLALEAALLLLLEKWMGKKQVTVDNRISDVTQEADTLPVNPDTLVLRMAVVTNPACTRCGFWHSANSESARSNVRRGEGGFSKGHKPVAGRPAARMDLQTLLLLVVTVITVLWLCRGRRRGPQQESRTHDRMKEETSSHRASLTTRAPPVEDFECRKVEEIIERQEVMVACMAIRADITQAKIDNINSPETVLKSSKHDDPDSL
ncbi:Protein of unknown function [Gryllus bimaculatus]|nr:Protein of unknown function [Gryllus bimaculatus]